MCDWDYDNYDDDYWDDEPAEPELDDTFDDDWVFWSNVWK